MAFEVRELASSGVGGERGDGVAVDVGDGQLGAGMRRSLRMMTRMPAGHDDMSSRSR